jgi:ribosomal protein L32
MIINRISPPQYAPLPPASQNTVPPPVQGRFSGVVVDISPEGWAAYNSNLPAAEGRTAPGGVPAAAPVASAPTARAAPSTTAAIEASRPQECQTCKSRKYQDVSNDSSVSFQAPSHISPGAAPSAVASHEREHVSHEQSKAARDDRRVVSQTVTLETSICPECGRVYISGGVTRTLTAAKSPSAESAAAEAVTPETVTPGAAATGAGTT